MIDKDAITLAFKQYRGGRIRVDDFIGSGGMGSVFKGFDTRINRVYAIKVLNPDLLDNRQVIKRFKREAIIMTQIDHPAIVRVYDLDDIDEVIPFILLEWIDGGSLWDYVESHGPMDSVMAVYVMTLVCAGIEAAHAKGVIHRDIKPDNILLATNGYPKVTDFGIALIERTQNRLTREGVGLGSFGFMAPEQMDHANEVDIRADVHGLGVTLWSILKAQMPTAGYIFGHDIAFNSDKLDGISAPIAAIIERATRINRDVRYSDVAEMRMALQRVIDSCDAVRHTHFYGGDRQAAGQLRLPTPRVGGSRDEDDRPIEDAKSDSEVPSESPASLASPDIGSVVYLSDDLLVEDSQFEFVLAQTRKKTRVRLFVILGSLLCAFAVGIFLALASKTPLSSHQATITSPKSVPHVPYLALRGPIFSQDRVARRVQETEILSLVLAPAEAQGDQPSVPSLQPVVSTHPVRKPVGNKSSRATAPAAHETPAIASQPEMARLTPEVVDPNPVVEMAPVIETSRVNVSFTDGDPVRVWLVGSGVYYRIPGSVPPGTYKVMGAFPSGERAVVSSLVISGGRSIRIVCNNAFAKCQAN